MVKGGLVYIFDKSILHSSCINEKVGFFCLLLENMDRFVDNHFNITAFVNLMYP